MADLPLSPNGDTAPPVQPLPSKRPGELRLQDIGRFLYTHNPFYAISASLVFWGLQSSFDLHIYTFQTFAMMGGLVGYTLVLSLAAFVVIRFGKVWDDGRSLLLLVILMLLAISVSFDVALARNLRNGTLCCVGGLLFSAVATEGLLRGLAIRLPALFRLPYYLVLGLFFLYPVALRWTLSDDPDTPGIQWALLAFPSLAAILCLSLLPAVRRGPQYVRDNGTPWPWPWYPWTGFFVLGLGICGRSYYLCMSMHQAGGFTTIFAPYFIVPFLLAANVLLLEGGLAARSVAATRVAMLAPAGLILLAMVPPSGKVSVRFLHEILFGTIGAGPLFLTTLAVAAFYGWAILRRVSYAVEALSAVLLILSVVGPKTVNEATIYVPPQAFPILVIGVIQVLLACATAQRAALVCGSVLRRCRRSAGVPRDCVHGVPWNHPGPFDARLGDVAWNGVFRRLCAVLAARWGSVPFGRSRRGPDRQPRSARRRAAGLADHLSGDGDSRCCRLWTPGPQLALLCVGSGNGRLLAGNRQFARVSAVAARRLRLGLHPLRSNFVDRGDVDQPGEGGCSPTAIVAASRTKGAESCAEERSV